MIVAALVSAAVIFLKIGEIRVVGETRYTRDEIIEASGLHVGQSMYLFNKFSSISSIFRECPFIDTVRMKRTLPDVLEIIVTPCQSIVAVKNEDAYYVLDEKGKILERADDVPDPNIHVVLCSGLETPEVGKMAVFFEEETPKALFSLLNTAKNSDILKNIGEIDVTKAYDVRFHYRERFIVAVGTADDLEHKFKFADAVIAQLGENEMGIIDVSDGQTGYFTPNRNIG